MTEQDRSSAINADINARNEWILQMDGAVAEVFESMLERNCAAVDECGPVGADICARIILSGAVSAQCAVEFPAASAEKLTCAFLGPCQDCNKIDLEDALVADAVGELCNMIAGGWKTRLGKLAWEADLSVPLILRGSSALAETDPSDGKVAVRRAYVFDESPFTVCLTVL